MTEFPEGGMYSILLDGGEHAAQPFIGRKISNAEMVNWSANEWDKLILSFTDGTQMSIYDGGQCCCESRYMSTDDNITDLIGKTLCYIDRKSAEYLDGDEYHEICFVEIGTLEGETVTLCSHNEHNGYYGGFSLVIE